MTSRRAAVLLALAGAGLAVLAGTRAWVTAPVTGVPGVPEVSVTGRQAAPVVLAVALAAAAGAVVLGSAGRTVRKLVAVGLLAAGAGIAGAALGVVADAAGAAAPAVIEATGVRGAGTADGAGITVWPYLAAAGGVLCAAGGVLGVVRGRSWPGPSRRYEVAAVDPDGPEDPASTWDALSRGEDPT